MLRVPMPHHKRLSMHMHRFPAQFSLRHFSNHIHPFTLFFSFFFFPSPQLPPPAPPAASPCISAIISWKKFSLTPPPVSAGECRGRIVFIFHPRGIAGSGR